MKCLCSNKIKILSWPRSLHSHERGHTLETLLFREPIKTKLCELKKKKSKHYSLLADLSRFNTIKFFGPFYNRILEMIACLPACYSREHSYIKGPKQWHSITFHIFSSSSTKLLSVDVEGYHSILICQIAVLNFQNYTFLS